MRLTACTADLGRVRGLDARSRRNKSQHGHKNGHGQYLKFIDRLPGILKFVPSAGRGCATLRHYLEYLLLFPPAHSGQHPHDGSVTL